jgi:hypothetical protein
MLLVTVNALVGGTLGQERTVLPLLAEEVFQLDLSSSLPHGFCGVRGGGIAAGGSALDLDTPDSEGSLAPVSGPDQAPQTLRLARRATCECHSETHRGRDTVERSSGRV